MSTLLKTLLLLSGFVSLILGVIGIFVPLLPTTPFLLLSAYCFLRSSGKAHNWLIRNPYLGKYIVNYKEKRALPLHAKIISVILVWVSVSFSVVYMKEKIWLHVVLVAIAIIVSVYIISLKTLKK